MSRTLVCSLLLAIALFVALGACGAKADPPVADQLQGVVLLTIDGLRADRVYGDMTFMLAPHLARLAARSMRFRDCSAGGNWTAPCWLAMFTGRAPSPVRPESADWTVAPGLATLPAILAANNVLVPGLEEFGRNGALGPGFAPVPPELAWGHSDSGSRKIGRALAWLDQNQQARFLLWIHLTDIHAPYGPIANRELRRELAGGHVPAEELMQAVNQEYDAQVAAVDAHVGILLAGLSKRGLNERVALVLLADHGEELFDRAPAVYEFGHPWETSRGTLRQELVHIPLLILAPNVPAADVQSPCSQADLAQTLLALFDAGRTWDQRSPLPGRNLLASIPPDDPLLSVGTACGHYCTGPVAGLVALRRGRHKLTCAAGVCGLIDLNVDPLEQNASYQARQPIDFCMTALLSARAMAEEAARSKPVGGL